MNFFSIDCSTDLNSLFLKIKNKTFIKNLQSDKSSSDLLMKEIIDFFKLAASNRTLGNPSYLEVEIRTSEEFKYLKGYMVYLRRPVSI